MEHVSPTKEWSVQIGAAAESQSRPTTNLTPKKRDRTPLQKTKFLRALGKNPNVTAACRRAGISRESAYAWRKSDTEFANAWENGIEMAIDSLEAEAIRRAKKDSDLLMIFLLKSHRPAIYRERYEHQIKNLPEMKKMVDAFVTMLHQYIPKEHVDSALQRFCTLAGLDLDAAKNRANCMATAGS